MNYLALLSVCATYAPGFFCVYNLSDWFQRRTVSQVKIKNAAQTRALPPPHLDEYSSQKSPPSRDG